MLNIHRDFAFKGIRWRSGHLYTFRYLNFSNDPTPTFLCMHAFSGYHPSTKKRWSFIQGINLTYVPREHRKAFANLWLRMFTATRGDLEFSWPVIQNYFPYFETAIRRYFYSPEHYIVNPIHVPFEDMEKLIVSTWSKDFSKSLRLNLISKFRSLTGKK